MNAITEPIADDVWEFLEAGTRKRARVTVGRPERTPDDKNGDWRCPLAFEGKTEGVLWVNGVGPVDALMNAMRFVSDRFNELEQVSPRAPETMK